MDKNKVEGVGLSFAASICGASVPIFSKLILEYFSPSAALVLRMVVSSFLIAVLAVVVMKAKIIIDRTTFRIAIFGSLNFVFFMFAINFMPAVIAPIFYSLVPIEVTLFSFIMYRDKISMIKLVGIIVGYIGALIVLFPSLGKASSSEIKPLGVALILMASCSIALYSIFVQKTNGKYSPYNLSFQSIVLSLIFSIPMAIFNSSDFRTTKEMNLNVIWFFVGIALIGTIGQYVIFQNGIAKIKASANVIFFYFQPLFVIIFSMIVLDERIGFAYVFGLLFVLIGSSLNMGVHKKVRALLNR